MLPLFTNSDDPLSLVMCNKYNLSCTFEIETISLKLKYFPEFDPTLSSFNLLYSKIFCEKISDADVRFANICEEINTILKSKSMNEFENFF